MFKQIQSAGFLIIAVLFCFASSAASQSLAVRTEEDLGQRQLEKVKIDAQSLGQLFSNLSLAYNIPIGAQAALNDDESIVYHLDLNRGTLAELLTRFVSDHPEYTCQIKDGVVRVFPRQNHRDPILVKLLAVQIKRFIVDKNTSCSGFERAIFSTPEMRKFLEANKVSQRERNFTGFYFPQLGQESTLRVKNETVESILNRVIRKSPTARFWFVTRSKGDLAILLTLNARHESLSGREQ